MVEAQSYGLTNKFMRVFLLLHLNQMALPLVAKEPR